MTVPVSKYQARSIAWWMFSWLKSHCENWAPGCGRALWGCSQAATSWKQRLSSSGFIPPLCFYPVRSFVSRSLFRATVLAHGREGQASRHNAFYSDVLPQRWSQWNAAWFIYQVATNWRCMAFVVLVVMSQQWMPNLTWNPHPVHGILLCWFQVTVM